jgi:hypothetical protein
MYSYLIRFWVGLLGPHLFASKTYFLFGPFMATLKSIGLLKKKLLSMLKYYIKFKKLLHFVELAGIKVEANCQTHMTIPNYLGHIWVKFIFQILFFRIQILPYFVLNFLNHPNKFSRIFVILNIF